MLSDVCSILIAVATGSFPDTPSLSLNHAWLSGTISSSLSLPLREEILRTSKNTVQIPDELLDGRSKPLEAADCSQSMLSVGLRVKASPNGSSQNGGSVTPDEQPAVQFGPVRVSSNSNFALVTWWTYWAPLASDFHFAILQRGKGEWRTVQDGYYGPVS